MFAKIKFMSKHCMCIFEHVLCWCVDVMCRVAFFSCHHRDIQLFNINLDTYFLICNVAINLDTWSSYLQCCHLFCNVARIPPVLTSDHARSSSRHPITYRSMTAVENDYHKLYGWACKTSLFVFLIFEGPPLFYISHIWC